jgi:hypothetical protein
MLFGTMAIFILLMMIFMVQIGKPVAAAKEPAPTPPQTPCPECPDTDTLRDTIAQYKEQVGELRGELEETQESLKEAQGQLDTAALEIVVAIDRSGTMGEELEDLMRFIRSVAEFMPRITPNFRIGIIAYGDEDGDFSASEDLEQFPLREIKPREVDDGKSFDLVDKFISGIQPKNSLAPVAEALELALEWLQRSAAQAQGRQVLILIGDVGTMETDWNGRKDYSREEQVRAESLALKVGRWIQASPQRSVLTFFSEHNPNDTNNADTQEFFEKIAIKSGQPENYKESTSDMVGALIEVISAANAN